MFEVVFFIAMAGALLMAALRVSAARREQEGGGTTPAPFPVRKRVGRYSRALDERDRLPMRW